MITSNSCVTQGSLHLHLPSLIEHLAFPETITGGYWQYLPRQGEGEESGKGQSLSNTQLVSLVGFKTGD